MVIGAFFPIGLLSLEQASMLWLISSVLISLAIIVIASGKRRPSPILLGLALLVVLLHPRSIAHFRIGQFTLLATFLFLMSARFINTPKYWLSALFVALSLSKPQLSILIVPGLLIARYQKGGIKAVLQFVALLLGFAILLTLPVFVMYPTWITDFLVVMTDIPNYLQPSLLDMLSLKLGTGGMAIWLAVAGFLFLVNIWIWIRRPEKEAILWSLALTPLVTPYIWSWDFVMMFPLFVWSMFQFRHNRSRIILLAGYLVAWILMISIIFNTDGHDSRFWWVPWLTMLVIVLASWVDSRPKKTSLVSTQG